jgi:hypothetical protein
MLSLKLILLYIIALSSFLFLYLSTLLFWANSMWSNKWDLAFGVISMTFSFFFAFIILITLSILIIRYHDVKKLVKQYQTSQTVENKVKQSAESLDSSELS